MDSVRNILSPFVRSRGDFFRLLSARGVELFGRVDDFFFFLIVLTFSFFCTLRASLFKKEEGFFPLVEESPFGLTFFSRGGEVKPSTLLIASLPLFIDLSSRAV